jgi:hypothetical protein
MLVWSKVTIPSFSHIKDDSTFLRNVKWSGQGHCAHLWTVVFAVWDWEHWCWIDYKPQLSEIQKTPGLYQSKETSAIYFFKQFIYVLPIEVDSLSILHTCY